MMSVNPQRLVIKELKFEILDQFHGQHLYSHQYFANIISSKPENKLFPLVFTLLISADLYIFHLQSTYYKYTFTYMPTYLYDIVVFV